ncbi:MAG: YadA-like family protein [Dialister sp.]|nr:YadA-like family protein [Dialister sp.]
MHHAGKEWLEQGMEIRKGASRSMKRLAAAMAVCLLIGGGSLSHAAPIENGAGATGEGAIAFGNGTTASGDYSVAMGKDTKASGWGSFAAGLDTEAKGIESVSLGYFTQALGSYSVAMGRETIASGEAAVVMGTRSQALGAYSFVMGRDAIGKGEESIAVGYGAQATQDYAMAIGTVSSARGIGSTAFGYGGKASGMYAVGIGYGSDAKGEMSLGLVGTTAEDATYSVAAGFSSQANLQSSVALGSFSVADREKGAVGYLAGDDTSDVFVATESAVSIGGGQNEDDVTVTRQITGLAAGSEDTDAVNVAQLKAVQSRIFAGEHVEIITIGESDKSTTYIVSVDANGEVEKDNDGIVTGGTVYNETRIAQDGAYTLVANTAGQNITALDTQVKLNADDIIRLNSRLDRVGAGAAALAALHPQDYDPEAKWDFAAGYGRYKEANALAIGVFYRPNDATMFSLGGSMGGGEDMMNVGLSLKVGHRGEYAGYSKAALTSVIADQKKQLDAQSEWIAKTEAENESLKDTVKHQQDQIDAILRKLEALSK